LWAFSQGNHNSLVAGQTAASDSEVGIPNMPDEITFPSSIGNVLFPHKLHVEDVEVECIQCHHEIRAKSLDTPHPDYLESSWINCQTCHSSDSGIKTDDYRCSACHHSENENIADETLSSKVVIHKNCWQCHETGTGADASEGCSGCHVKENT
jgi:hypothetical protein